MPKKTKTVEEHLQTIEYLFAGLILKKEIDIKKVAKIIGCSDNKLTKVLSGKKRKIKTDEKKDTTKHQ
jgi:DNA-binding Xre family transcriptional regulator